MPYFKLYKSLNSTWTCPWSPQQILAQTEQLPWACILLMEYLTSTSMILESVCLYPTIKSLCCHNLDFLRPQRLNFSLLKSEFHWDNSITARTTPEDNSSAFTCICSLFPYLCWDSFFWTPQLGFFNRYNFERQRKEISGGGELRSSLGELSVTRDARKNAGAKLSLRQDTAESARDMNGSGS